MKSLYAYFMKHCPSSTVSRYCLSRPASNAASFSRTALLLISGLIVFSPLMDGGTTHVAVMITRLMVFVLLGTYIVHGISAGTIQVPHIAPAPAIAGYLVLAIASTILSPYTNQSMQWILVLMSYAVFLYVLVAFLTAWQCIGVLLVILSGMGLFEAGWIIIQACWYGKPRPSGTFFNPNFVAGYLAAIWVVMFSVFCSAIPSRIRWITSTPYRVFGVLSVGILLGVTCVAIVLTRSRGGGVALLGGLALVMWLRFGRKGISVFLVVLLAGILIPNPWRDRFYIEYLINPVGYARWQIWQSSLLEMLEHPFGIGLGLYQYEAPRYMFPIEGEIARYGWVAQAAHNEYLQMGVELGLPSILLFFWGVLAIAQEVRKGLSVRLKRWQRGVLVGTSSAAAGILLHAVVDSNLHEPAIAILLAVCVGITLSVRRLSTSAIGERQVVAVRSRTIVAVLSILVIGGLAVEVVQLGCAWMVYEEGSLAVMEQDLLRGIALYRNAVALDPGKAMYHRSMAAAHFQMFQRNRNAEAVQAALVELQIASSLNPLDGRTHERLGSVYALLASSQSDSDKMSAVQRKQKAVLLQSAFSTYLRALEREPFSAFHRLELGRLSLTLGDQEGAQRFVQESLAMEPNFLPGRVWLVRLYLDTKQTDAAIREYGEIVERHKRYAYRQKNPMEEQFLNVDIRELEAALEKAGVRI